MKRIGLFLLAVVMVAGLVGCGKDGTEHPIGTWVMSYDFGCTGKGYSAVWHIYDNGTYIDSFGYHGTFNVDGDTITLNYSAGAVYSGKVHGDSMTGTLVTVGGTSGCWTATRTSTTP